jgi:Kdo2-lipid IVA lauroyltransferase/acyltransferase
VNNVVRGFIKRGKNDLILAAVHFVLFVHRLLPRRLGLAVFDILGAVAYWFPNRERTRTVEHLRLIFSGQWPEKKILSVARRVYRELGKNVFDAVYFARCNNKRLEKNVLCDDLGEFRRAYDRGKGIVAITAHCGCFEMLLHYFAAQGFNSFAIGKEVYDRRLDRLVTKMRSGPNITYIYSSENPRTIIRLLKEGKLMGALIDQDTRVDGVFVHFLGKLAYTPSTPVKLAMRYDIPVFVVTTARQENGKHRIFVSERVALRKWGDETRDRVKNVETVNDLISATILKYPTQWVWMHRRWQRQPEDEGYMDVPNIERYEEIGKR